MLSLNPEAVDLKTTLPSDWRDRLASYSPPSLSPLIAELQRIVVRRGNAAIAIEHVQALARMACGVAQQTTLEAYERLFAMLRTGAGGDWPIEEVFPEASLEKKAPLDAAQRLIGCDGEWLVVAAFIAAGWKPIRDPERKLGDWCVTRDGVTLGVEVKTKQSEGNTRGRFQFAFRGLAFLPEAAFLNKYNWYWNRGIDLRQKWASRYSDLLFSALPQIEQTLRQPPPMHVGTEVASTADSRLSVFRYEENKFAFDFEPVKSEERNPQSTISLHAEPSWSSKYFVNNTADAAMMRHDDEGMLEDLAQVIGRLNIEHQADARAGDTVFALIWEVPFQWNIRSRALQQFWDRWCGERSVKNGILMPIHVGTRFTPIVTESARTLSLHEVDLNRLGEPDRMASKS